MNPINSANLLLLAEKGVREMKRIRPEEKDVLNPGEAIEYWNFSRRKFFDFIKQPRKCDYLAYYGERILIIREAFDNYLKAHPEVKEELANGRSRQKQNKT